jgi:hypothetical protein
VSDRDVTQVSSGSAEEPPVPAAPIEAKAVVVDHPAQAGPLPVPHVTVTTNASMRFSEVGPDGKVTTFEAGPKAAKRFLLLTFGAIALGSLIVLVLIIRLFAR